MDTMTMRSLCCLMVAGLLATCSDDSDPRIEGIVVATIPSGWHRFDAAGVHRASIDQRNDPDAGFASRRPMAAS